MRKGNKNYVLTLNPPIKLKHIEPEKSELVQIKELILREFIDPTKGVKLMKEMMESLDANEFHYFFPTLNYSAENGDKAILNEEKFNKRFLSNKYRHSYLIYSNELYMDNIKQERLIGIISIDNVKFYNKNCFVSIFINKQFRGYGLALLTIKLIKNRVFNDGIYDGSSRKIMHKIKTYINIDNINAIKVFKKAGFYKVGVYTDEEYRDDGYCDMVSMECLNRDVSSINNALKKIKSIF